LHLAKLIDSTIQSEISYEVVKLYVISFMFVIIRHTLCFTQMLVEWRAAGASSHAAPAQETRTFGAFWLDTCYSDAQVAVVYAADGRIAVELPCHRLVLAHVRARMWMWAAE
jgi:hypothetical protein